MKRVSPVGEFEIGETMDPRMMRGSTEPMPVPPYATALPVMGSAVREISYHPTRWPFVNHTLDLVEEYTNGKAGLVQRLCTYLLVGGFAALINLIVFHILFNSSHLPVISSISPSATITFPVLGPKAVAGMVHWLASFLIATEISIIANFIPNDLITFSHLPGHSRSWIMRGARFHLTCVAGTILTLILSAGIDQFGVNATIGQGTAIIIATGFNFFMHHFFTYRHEAVEAL